MHFETCAPCTVYRSRNMGAPETYIMLQTNVTSIKNKFKKQGT